jgi:hypothetical protein
VSLGRGPESGGQGKAFDDSTSGMPSISRISRIEMYCGSDVDGMQVTYGRPGGTSSQMTARGTISNKKNLKAFVIDENDFLKSITIQNDDSGRRKVRYISFNTNGGKSFGCGTKNAGSTLSIYREVQAGNAIVYFKGLDDGFIGALEVFEGKRLTTKQVDDIQAKEQADAAPVG